LKSIKKIALAAVMVVTVASVSGCNLIVKTPQGIANSPVAKVNDDTITKAQLDARMAPEIAQLKSQYGNDYASNSQVATQLKTDKASMVTQMENELLTIQYAKSKNLIPSDTELNKEITTQYNSYESSYQTQASSSGSAATSWSDYLKQNGYTVDMLKDQIKTNIITNKVVDYLTKNTKITDKQIQDYYNQNPENYTTTPNTFDFAHILVKTQAEAEQIKAELDKGADFATEAKKDSTDTGSSANGGDLGSMSYTDAQSQLDPTFLAAAVKLKQGEISNPVQTQFGWHIIKCISRTNNPLKPLDATLKKSISDTLLQNAKQTAYNNSVKSWKNAAKIKEYPQNE
jgi:foldase protein PrsA